MEHEDEEGNDEFISQISIFHSSFKLYDAILSKKKASFECRKLEAESKEGYDTIEEEIAINNLISYLNWCLGKKERALAICNESLKKDESNIIALANKARILWSFSRFHEANQVLEQLQHLKNGSNFDRLHCSAKAEIAYSYSRFGPRYHIKCIQLFQEVLVKFPENCEWKFGLGMIYRRETHMLNTTRTVEGSNEECTIKAINLLSEVLTSDGSSQNLKAKTLCEIGLILYCKDKHERLFSYLPNSLRLQSAEDYFLKALEICPDDLFVLQRSGRHFRHSGKIDKSIENLRKARAIIETPFNLHHLALSLIKKAEKEESDISRYSSIKSGAAYPSLQRNIVQNSSKNFSDVRNKPSSSSEKYIPPHKRATSCRRSYESQEKSIDDRKTYKQNYEEIKSDVEPSESVPSLQVCENLGQHQNECHFELVHDSNNQSHIERRQFGDLGLPSKIIQKCFKSPKESENVIQDSPLLLEAAEYLKRAVDLREGEFSQALYELGRVYRKLDQCEKAVEAFTQSFSIESCTKIEKIRAIEQIGLCKLDMSKRKSCSEEEAETYYSEAKTSLFKAVSLMAGLCSQQPELEIAFSCFPTLHSILEGENIPRNISATRELAKLHEMMGKYKDAISFYEEIRSCLRNNTPVDVLLDLLRNYEKINDFDKAIFLLNTMCVSQDTRKNIDRNRYLRLHINAWEYNQQEKQADMAKLYIKDGFIFARSKSVKNEYSRDDVMVYLLCPCGEMPCAVGEHIKETLQSLCDIIALHNTIDCLHGAMRKSYIEESMDQCDFMILLNSCDSTSAQSKFFMDMDFTTEGFRSKAIVIGNDTNEPRFRALKRIPLPDSRRYDIASVKTLLENVLID